VTIGQIGEELSKAGTDQVRQADPGDLAGGGGDGGDQGQVAVAGTRTDDWRHKTRCIDVVRWWLMWISVSEHLFNVPESGGGEGGRGQGWGPGIAATPTVKTQLHIVA